MSLFAEINKVLSGGTSPENKSTYLKEDSSSSGQMEKVRLYSANRVLREPDPGVKQLAEAMVELGQAHGMCNVDRDPMNAMVSAVQLYRTDSHTPESWKIMGKLVETAHNNFKLPLKETLGKYNESQLKLLEMTLQLPWKLNYSEPISPEVTDYPIPQEQDIWKGEISEEAETKATKLSKLRETRTKLIESHSREVAMTVSQLRFDDPLDVEYQAEDIAKGLVDGIMKNRDIRNKEDLVAAVAEKLEQKL